MAQGFSTLIQEIQKILPAARGEGQSNWNANVSDHRQQIRASLRASLGGEGFDDSPPRPLNWSVSISHARFFGGWLAVPRPHRVGFDVEVSERIQPRIIERVCSRQEVAECPNPAFLWCAKESYYKCMEHDQPETISQLTVSNWKAMAPGIFTFQPEKNIRGILIEDANAYYCACLRVSI